MFDNSIIVIHFLFYLWICVSPMGHGEVFFLDPRKVLYFSKNGLQPDISLSFFTFSLCVWVNQNQKAKMRHYLLGQASGPPALVKRWTPFCLSLLPWGQAPQHPTTYLCLCHKKERCLAFGADPAFWNSWIWDFSPGFVTEILNLAQCICQIRIWICWV